jgi:hypothetical protein
VLWWRGCCGIVSMKSLQTYISFTHSQAQRGTALYQHDIAKPEYRPLGHSAQCASNVHDSPHRYHESKYRGLGQCVWARRLQRTARHHSPPENRTSAPARCAQGAILWRVCGGFSGVFVGTYLACLWGLIWCVCGGLSGVFVGAYLVCLWGFISCVCGGFSDVSLGVHIRIMIGVTSDKKRESF